MGEYEVELKVPTELGAVAERLDALDAEFRGAVTQVDTYYDAPHRSFERTDEALRIRRETHRGSRTARSEDDGGRSSPTGGPARSKITYKGPLIDDRSKTRAELETGVEDGDTAETIFRRLGFDPVATVEKSRERYDLEGYTVTLDEVEDVGSFVEVETHADKSGLDDARRGAERVLERLDVDPDGSVRTSYLELLLEK